MARRVVDRFVGDAQPARHLQRRGDVRDLLGRVAVGAERDPDAGGDRAGDEALVRAIAVRNLEGDAGAGERCDGALFARLGPELLERHLAKRHREEGGMGEDVDGHLAGEALEVVEVRVHVILRVKTSRPWAREGVKDAAVRQEDRVEAAEPVREAGREIVRQFAPEVVVPAELAAAENIVAIELVEIIANRGYRIERTAHVSRTVVGNGRPNASGRDLRNELLDGEDAVGEGGVSVEVDGPRGAVRGADWRTG